MPDPTDTQRNRTDSEDRKLSDCTGDELPSITGMLYIEKNERHLLQVKTDAGEKMEFEIESEDVAVGFRDVGQDILESQESVFADAETRVEKL